MRFKIFKKKDPQVFKLFIESARVVIRGGDILKNVVDDYRDLDLKMAKLTAMEHEGDRIIQDLVRKLDSSYVLPLDREDAFQVVQKLATTLDYITGIIDRMILYKAEAPNKKVKEMVDILIESLHLQEKAFNLLDNLNKNKKEILDICDTIRQLERKQDHNYRNGLADLFENEEDPVKIIKWKEVYEHIEIAQDYVEDVAELIRNICLKYS
ncbi:Phosphate transport regulator [Candidatus Syntrophocurvum alkaliphilum]|uniref:Phosphate transport regulator n=1 Tax=Candidatus Syntrophocurvum alkaliphilum TaxID=2293317 RepID=A0A6I6D8J3_9FIRM|nr:DUF47 family protein [Candidatus Syntrophocurvum alkaliphilum]QGT99233.1 Phosphate transport regulator [Candidatus Syntrophocurvum alkaliphilum]